MIPEFVFVPESSNKTLDLINYLCSLSTYCKNELSSKYKEMIAQRFNEIIGCPELSYSSKKDSIYASGTNQGTGTRVRKGAFCGKAFVSGEVVYSCRNCGADPTCVLCEPCFKASEHEGHEVHISFHSQGFGCCDCGDLEAFENLVCAHHSQDLKVDLKTLSLNLPERVRDGVDLFTEAALDFVILVFKASPDRMLDCVNKSFIKQDGIDTENLFLRDPNSKKDNTDTEELFLRNPNSKSLNQYSLILWNDEKHSYDQVINLFNQALPSDSDLATSYTRAVDLIGRKTVQSSTSIDALLELSQPFQSGDLGVTIRSSHAVFLEDLAAFLIHYFFLISHPSIGDFKEGYFLDFFLEIFSKKLMSNRSAGLVKEFLEQSQLNNKSTAANRVMRYDNEIISSFSEKFDLRRYEILDIVAIPKHLRMGPSMFPPNIFYLLPARINKLFEIDCKLWKVAQLEMKELYARSILGVSSEYKQLSSMYYALNYSEIARPFYSETPVFTSSLLGFSVQIFTVSSIAKKLHVEMDFVRCLLIVLEEYFGNRRSIPDAYSIVHQNIAKKFDCADDPFENSYLLSLIHDIACLIEHKAVQRVLHKDTCFLAQFLYFLTRIQGINPYKRQVGDHVEYPNVGCYTAIRIMVSTFDLIQGVAKSYQYDPVHLLEAIRNTLVKIYVWTIKSPGFYKSNNERWKYQKGSKSVEINGTCYHSSTFVVEAREVSYHCPLHWLLSLLLQTLCSLEPWDLQKLGDTMLDVLVGKDKKLFDSIEVIFDIPLRALVLASQVRANLWIRNGREIYIETDSFSSNSHPIIHRALFLAQFQFLAFSCENVLANMLVKFNLLPWLEFSKEPHIYEPHHAVTLAIDFFLLIIYCVSERDLGMKANDEALIRKLIIQNTFKPVKFSKLSSIIPNDLKEHHKFLSILTELCDFKSPDATGSGAGTYCLKKQFYHEINPFDYFFSQNDFNEVDSLKAKYVTEISPYFRPKVDYIKSGVFVKIGNILHNDVLIVAIFGTLAHCVEDHKTYSDLLDFVIFLYIYANEDFNSDYSTAGKSGPIGGLWANSYDMAITLPDSEAPKNCLDLFMQLAKSESYHDKRDKLLYVISLIGKYGGELAQSETSTFLKSLKEREQDLALQKMQEKKKRDAKARMERIQSAFKKTGDEFIKQQKDLYTEVREVGGELATPVEGEDGLAVDKGYLTGNCILCQEPGTSDAPYGMICHILASKALSLLSYEKVDLYETAKCDRKGLILNKDNPDTSEQCCISSFSSKTMASQPPPTDPHTMAGNFVTSCGHLMHLNCLREHEMRSINFLASSNRPTLLQNKDGKFQCPLCKSFNNAILPVVGNPGLGLKLTLPEFDYKFEWIDQLDEIELQVSESKQSNTVANDIDSYSSDTPPHPINHDDDNGSVDSLQEEQEFPMMLPEGLVEIAQEPGNLLEFLNRLTTASSQVNTTLDPLDSIQLVDKAYQSILAAFRNSFTQLKKCTPPVSADNLYGKSDKSYDSMLNSLAYTITFVEIADRIECEADQSKHMPNILDRIPTITHDVLVMLWNTILSVHNNSNLISSLSPIPNVHDLFKNMLSPSCLDIDSINYLIGFCVNDISKLGIDVRHIIQMLILLQLYKAVAAVMESILNTSSQPDTIISPMPSHYVTMVKHVLIHGMGLDQEEVIDYFETKRIDQSFDIIYTQLLVFAKKAILFLNIAQVDLDRKVHDDDQLDLLLLSMGLPCTSDLFTLFTVSHHYTTLLTKWSHKSIKLYLEYPYPYQLQSLPNRLDQLYNPCDQLLNTTCKTNPEGPAICLLCGQVICMAPYCCTQTATTWYHNHALKCSSTIGLYLIPKKSRVFYTFQKKHLTLPAPFLTLHGEPNIRNQGLPLFFNSKRYQVILKAYIKHQIPNLVTRNSSSQHGLFTIQ